MRGPRRRHVDERHDCRDIVPACVPSTVWGTASMRNRQVGLGAVLAPQGRNATPPLAAASGRARPAAPHRSRRHAVTYPAIADMPLRQRFPAAVITPPIQALRARYARVRAAIDMGLDGSKDGFSTARTWHSSGVPWLGQGRATSGAGTRFPVPHSEGSCGAVPKSGMVRLSRSHLPGLSRKVRGPPLWRASAFQGSGFGRLLTSHRKSARWSVSLHTRSHRSKGGSLWNLPPSPSRCRPAAGCVSRRQGSGPGWGGSVDVTAAGLTTAPQRTPTPSPGCRHRGSGFAGDAVADPLAEFFDAEVAPLLTAAAWWMPWRMRISSVPHPSRRRAHPSRFRRAKRAPIRRASVA